MINCSLSQKNNKYLEIVKKNPSIREIYIFWVTWVFYLGGVCRCPSCDNIFSRPTGPFLRNLVCNIDRVKTQEIVNFMTLTISGGNFVVKELNWYSSLLHGMVHTNWIYTCSLWWPSWIYLHCNFHDSGEEVFVLGHDHISHFIEYALYSTLSMYSSLIAIVVRDYNSVFLCRCWFF